MLGQKTSLRLVTQAEKILSTYNPTTLKWMPFLFISVTRSFLSKTLELEEPISQVKARRATSLLKKFHRCKLTMECSICSEGAASIPLVSRASWVGSLSLMSSLAQLAKSSTPTSICLSSPCTHLLNSPKTWTHHSSEAPKVITRADTSLSLRWRTWSPWIHLSLPWCHRMTAHSNVAIVTTRSLSPSKISKTWTRRPRSSWKISWLAESLCKKSERTKPPPNLIDFATCQTVRSLELILLSRSRSFQPRESQSLWGATKIIQCDAS